MILGQTPRTPRAPANLTRYRQPSGYFSQQQDPRFYNRSQRERAALIAFIKARENFAS